jgi:HD-GYP domain-containing protein (c-di-GMP phosphodiesterase class II)
LHSVNVDQIKPGEIIAKTFFGENGRLMIKQGTKLTDDLINRMKLHNITMVFIEDNHDVVCNDIIDPHLRAEAIQSLEHIYTSLKDQIQSKEKFVLILDNIVKAMIDDLAKNSKNFIGIIDLKTHDDFTYAHSVNVAILSIVTGMAIGCDYIKLKNIGIGAMLHDIGKASIPVEILNKVGKLTAEEFDLIKKHPEIGYRKSKLQLDIEPTSRAIILQHHEKLDGTGYPGGRTSDTIHQFAKIVAIADIYDAITSERPYRKRWPIKESLDFLQQITGNFIDPEIYKAFSNRIAPYPVGCKVMVSDNRVGYVIDNTNLTRPIIGFSNGDTFDLSKENSLYLREIVD